MFGASSGKITFIATVSLIALAGVYMKRDLALTGDAFGDKLPPIMAENLNFARRINGREWRVSAENAESEGGIVRASSIAVSVSDTDASRSADVNARVGAFDLESDRMWLREIAGTVYLSDGSVDISAPRADYDMSGDVWFFSEGVSASDDKIHVTGRAARIDSGAVTLGNGARVTWQLE
ncbi:MAG: hypothetical protein LBE65_02775 [Synergistaceae bacterium]|jgi:hypothetical protein|nr:hypothetical protein [Synergistaceae bacterium]